METRWKFVVPTLALVLGVQAHAADLEEGIRLYQAKEYQQAEVALRKAVEAAPDNPEANYRLGMTLLELKKYEESEACFNKASKAKPEARVGLGRALMERDRYDSALREFDQAARALPKSAEVHRYKGMILLKQEKYAAAAQELTAAVDLDPRDAYAHYYLGMAQSRLRRPDLMVKHFEFFLKLAPDAPEAAKVRSLLRSL